MVHYSVFISHSMRQEDLEIVYSASKDANLRGIGCYIAERDWQFGKSVPAKISNAIRSCDCLVAFITAGGAHSAWVNQEIGHAVGSRKPRILVVEKGVQVQGFDIGNECIVLERSKPWDAIGKLNTHLSHLKLAKEKKETAGLFVLGIVALLGLFGGKK